MIDKDKIKEIISLAFNVKIEDIKDTSNFIEDLGADSLCIAELIYNMEDHFKVKIPTEKIRKLKTVKDIMDYLGGNI